ncbi:hypothetical protein Tco_0189898 [Tanacetum coccineum]
MEGDLHTLNDDDLLQLDDLDFWLQDNNNGDNEEEETVHMVGVDPPVVVVDAPVVHVDALVIALEKEIQRPKKRKREMEDESVSSVVAFGRPNKRKRLNLAKKTEKGVKDKAIEPNWVFGSLELTSVHSLILGGPQLFLLCNSSECSALMTIPTIIQKRKKTAKAPVEQSNVEKEKADIRKRLHLSKEDMDDRSEAVKKVYYQWMAHEDCAMLQFVTFKKEIFWDVDEFTLPINPTDIIELLTGEKLGTNILVLFSRGHVLLIICPNHGRGFILDSFK